MTNTIQSGQTLTCRSISDYDCIFELQVIERKGGFAFVKHLGNLRKVKVRLDHNGNEYLMPDRYSMAPIFLAPNQ